MLRTITRILPLKQLKDPRLIIFCLVNSFYTLGYYVPLDFLPDAMTKEHAISQLRAGNVISFYGVASTIGRLTGAVITNYMKKSALLLIVVCMLSLGCACFGMAFSSYYWHFVIVIFVYGIFLGMFSILRPISLIDMFGMEYLKESYGIIMLCNGISTLLGPPMAGWVKVLSGYYYYDFLITSGIFSVGGVLALFLFFENRKDKYNMDNETQHA